MKLWGVVLVLWIVASYATTLVNPGLFHNLAKAPLGWVASLLLLAGLGLAFAGIKREQFLLAFLGSGAFVLRPPGGQRRLRLSRHAEVHPGPGL